MMPGHFLEELWEHQSISQASKPALGKPRKFKVILLNDDYTPMDFVVEVLAKFFNLGEVEATQIMLQVHHQGKGVCGVYTKDIAETKVAQVNAYSQSQEHPLLCVMEPE